MENSKLKKIIGISMLLLTAIIWGFTFPIQKAASDTLPSLSFTGLRYLIGAVPVLILALIVEKKKEKKLLLKTVVAGMICGSFMFIATCTQQYYLTFVDTSGKASFLTSIYILLVPLIRTIFGKRPGLFTWFGVMLGLIGMFLLTVKSGFSFEITDLIIFSSALFWALHIITTGHFAEGCYPLTFAFFQFLTVGILGSVGMFSFESISTENILSVWPYLMAAGVLSVGIAFTLQVLAQRNVDTTTSAIVLSTESVFGAIGGVLFTLIMPEYFHESMLTAKEIIGCVLIFAGIMIAQIKTERKN